MTTGEFAELVQKMRTAQKKYFKTKLKSALEESRMLENEVDKILEERERQTQAKQPTLFDIY